MPDSVTTSQAVLAPGRYRVDQDQSQVRYTGKHMFGLGTVHATFSIRAGQIEVADPIESSSATVVVDAASFHSDSARRDKDVRSAGLLDVANHPTITFASHELRRSGDGWLAIGTLTVHGRTFPVHVLLDVVQQKARGIRMHGRAEHLDRTAFGITGFCRPLPRHRSGRCRGRRLRRIGGRQTGTRSGLVTSESSDRQALCAARPHVAN